MYSSAARLQALVVDLAGFDLAQDAVDRQLVAVELVDVVLELRLAGEHGLDLDLLPEGRAQLVQRHHVEHLGDGDRQDLLLRVERDGQHAVAAREVLRDQLDRIPIDHDLRQVDALLADGPGHDVPDHRLGDEAHAHQQAAERGLLLLLLGQRDAQLIGRDQSLLNQQLAQAQLFALLAQRVALARCQCAR